MKVRTPMPRQRPSPERKRSGLDASAAPGSQNTKARRAATGVAVTSRRIIDRGARRSVSAVTRVRAAGRGVTLAIGKPLLHVLARLVLNRNWGLRSPSQPPDCVERWVPAARAPLAVSVA